MTHDAQTPLSILLIAPQPPGLPELSWWREFNQLLTIENIAITVLGHENATVAHVANALHERHDVIVWSGHGEKNMLITSDSMTVDGTWLATHAQVGAPRVVVIATCWSAAGDNNFGLIGNLSRAGINAIGMSTMVEDRVALLYSVEFVRALSANDDVAIAHQIALHNLEQQYPNMSHGIVLLPGLMNGYHVIAERLEDLENRLLKLEKQIALLLNLIRRITHHRGMYDDVNNY